MVLDKNGKEVRDVVSIIIPYYNSEFYFRECLESVTTQTYPYLEILCIDNKSTDSSNKICQEFAEDDPRIRMFCNKKHGLVGLSRNVGLEKATGRYIAFLDSDDIMLPEAIETMVRTMVEQEVDIVQTCYKKLLDNGKIVDDLPYDSFHIYSGRDLCLQMSKFIGLCSPNVMLWTKLYKRELWENKMFYEQVTYEDIFVTYKVLYPVERIAFIPDRLFYWRKGAFSGTSKFTYYSVNYVEIKAYRERALYFKKQRDKELYALTLKRCYYIATQHIYLQKQFVPKRAGGEKNCAWLKSLIKELYPELMKMKCWPKRTRRRMKFIRYFPWLFGAISVNHKLDFRI